MSIVNNNGKPWQDQFESNESFGGDITGWTAETSLPVAVGYGAAAITTNRVYLFYRGTNYTAPIDQSGTIGTWQSISGPTIDVEQQQIIVTKNYIYSLGGDINSAPQSCVQYALVNSDGTIGAWVQSANSLPVGLRSSNALVTRNRVYMFGGASGSGTISSIYTAPIDSNGIIGAWSYHGETPFGPGSSKQAWLAGNYVYLTGATVWPGLARAPFESDGIIGSWENVTQLPARRMGASTAVTNKTVYVIGGDYSGAKNTVYYSQLNSNGDLSSWTTGTVLPISVAGAHLVITSSKIYIIGGLSLTSVISAPFTGGANSYVGWYSPEFWTNFKGQTEII